MSHRSLYTLLLIAGALVQLGCSAPGEQPPSDAAAAVPASASSSATPANSAPASTAPAAGGSTTLLGGIGPGDREAAGADTPLPPKAAAAQAQAAQAQAQALAAQCSDLRSQIRGEQVTERAAPSTSIDEDIVNATVAKADKRIDQLQQQYDSLGCPDSQLPPTHDRVPQLPPAPGGLSH